jgi:hypothetical protein
MGIDESCIATFPVSACWIQALNLIERIRRRAALLLTLVPSKRLPRFRTFEDIN